MFKMTILMTLIRYNQFHLSFLADKCQKSILGIPCVFPYVKSDTSTQNTFYKCQSFEGATESPICALWGPGSLHPTGEHWFHADCEDECEKQGI